LLRSLRRLSQIEKTNFQRLKNIFGWPSASSGGQSVNPSADSPPSAATAAKLAGRLLSGSADSLFAISIPDNKVLLSAINLPTSQPVTPPPT